MAYSGDDVRPCNSSEYVTLIPTANIAVPSAINRIFVG
jgi:hypothetical protein